MAASRGRDARASLLHRHSPRTASRAAGGRRAPPSSNGGQGAPMAACAARTRLRRLPPSSTGTAGYFDIDHGLRAPARRGEDFQDGIVPSEDPRPDQVRSILLDGGACESDRWRNRAHECDHLIACERALRLDLGGQRHEGDGEQVADQRPDEADRRTFHLLAAKATAHADMTTGAEWRQARLPQARGGWKMSEDDGLGDNRQPPPSAGTICPARRSRSTSAAGADVTATPDGQVEQSAPGGQLASSLSSLPTQLAGDAADVYAVTIALAATTVAASTRIRSPLNIEPPTYPVTGLRTSRPATRGVCCDSAPGGRV